MAEKIISFPSPVEPLMKNRWLLKVGNIPEYLIRDVDLESFVEDGGTYTKLNFSIMNIIGYTVIPDDIIGLKNIKLEFLDPTGVVVNGYDMKVKFERMSFKCDYGDNGLLTHNFIFYVKHLDQLYTNQGEKSEKELIKTYKENKKKEKESV